MTDRFLTEPADSVHATISNRSTVCISLLFPSLHLMVESCMRPPAADAPPMQTNTACPHAAVMYLYQIYQNNMAPTVLGLFPMFVGAVSVEGIGPLFRMHPSPSPCSVLAINCSATACCR